ncbi:ATP-binding protein [Sphaerisporangium perillae]|uniref:ATP-binding protein n=1 Tax=Sphaerisporangium perillae TaxID=2935860 RepID=UPI00200D74B0|nr:ATP-binding protein [Sphaerisporangium perillae]
MPRISASLDSLDQVAGYVLTLAERAGLPSCLTDRLRLAADELATNIVVHGYGEAGGEFAVEGGMDGDSVWVRFEDDARPFDPRAGLRCPEYGVPFGQRRIGGLGVYLALTAVDGFTYRRVAGRNISTLRILRDGAHEKDQRTCAG